jgi:hypothetical protein
VSANNWGICPRCKAKREDDVRALDIDLAQSYGEVPIEQFDHLRAERDKLATAEPERTLREDYEIWINQDGRFYASYVAHCSVCQFKHTLLQDEQLDVRAGQ